MHKMTYCNHAPPEPDCLQCLHSINQGFRTRIAALEAENEKLREQREVLIQYAKHNRDCVYEPHVVTPKRKCNCGLWPILTQIAQE